MAKNKLLEPYELDYLAFDDFDNGTMSLVLERLLEEVGYDDIFIDLGAYIGCVSVPVMVQKKPYLTIAVEANTTSFPLLERNIKKYGENGHYRVYNRVCADKTGTVQFCQADNTGSLVREYDKTYWPLKKCNSVCVDDLLSEYNPDYRKVVLKIDVELGEPIIWQGMKKSFNDIKFIIMEFFFSAMKAQNIDPLVFYNEIINDGFKFYDLHRKPLDRARFIDLSDSFNQDFILTR